MRNKIKYLIVGTFVLLLALFNSSLVSSQEDTSSISGTVTPAKAGIKVKAIQNLSIIGEAVTDEKGKYIINDLKQGDYGLLFVRDGIVYIYNDEINLYWEREGVKENISVTEDKTSIVDINLMNEAEDY
ncbi:carboxypeptidase regulatory-like domain-containing protein [Candidatus Pacearchaeota archaeon]|nr:carboxypeptidase regulatory-like domain-containing protein [Candidatus Pacearchaeota archaeon]